MPAAMNATAVLNDISVASPKGRRSAAIPAGQLIAPSDPSSTVDHASQGASRRSRAATSVVSAGRAVMLVGVLFIDPVEFQVHLAESRQHRGFEVLRQRAAIAVQNDLAHLGVGQ